MSAEKSNPWELAQNRLQEVMDSHSYDNWFSQTRFESLEGGNLVVGVPSQFFANWLRDHYLEAISASLREVIPDFKDVQFITASDLPAKTNSTPTLRLKDVARNSKRKVQAFKLTRHGFNRRYSFDRFVIGSGNRFAHAAATRSWPPRPLRRAC